jgi:hypothetical protein
MWSACDEAGAMVAYLRAASKLREANSGMSAA